MPQPSPVPLPVRPGSPAFTLMLGALGALPPLSIDMGLPALPAIARGLGTSNGSAGLTLSLFLVGYALSQAMVGPLSDRFGRRPVLLCGLSLYAACGLGATLAPSIGALLGWRVLQGAGAACGPVMAFAVVRDTFEGSAGRAKLSYVTMVLSVAPIVAPTLGGFILGWSGWRAIYAVLSATGLVLVVAVALGLRETRGPAHRVPIAAGFRRVLTDKRCMAYAAVNALTFAGLFAFIGGSPLVLIGSMGVSIGGFGALFATAACGLIVGSWVNGRLATRGVPPTVPLWGGLLVALAAAVIPLGLQLAEGLGPVGLIVFMLASTTCRGLVNPNAVHGAMEGLPELAGAVSAMLGCLQTLAAAAAGAAVALLHPWMGPTAMTAVMTVATSAALLAMLATRGWRA
jgi:DHA1 family bicyclomycin/chloramphenicol resistance-like MFS transporter